jgi:Damage-control phosphatase ARMT1-like domain
MSRRVAKDILPRIIEDNKDELTRPTSPLRAECLLQLSDLIASLESKETGYLRGLCDAGPDLQYWDDVLRSIDDDRRNWIQAPWVITEFYLYRRIVEAFRFFETGYDMFEMEKFKGLYGAMSSINDITEKIPVLLAEGNDPRTVLELGIQTSLWGNKIDLSLWPAASSSKSSSSDDNQENKAGSTVSFGAALSASRSFILDDQTANAVTHILKPSAQTAASIIVDNAGYELFSDLFLGHLLLSLKVVEKVIFHTKAHPTFVSDATTNDCRQTIGYLASADVATASTREFGAILQSYVDDGRFEFVDDLFWCQPTPFWDMPQPVETKLSSSKIAFVKGDANYRRLLGERQWPLDTPSNNILSYFPVPVCALRTFKAEIGCGISSENQERASAADSKWQVSGRWGVIQFND